MLQMTLQLAQLYRFNMRGTRDLDWKIKMHIKRKRVGRLPIVLLYAYKDTRVSQTQ